MYGKDRILIVIVSSTADLASRNIARKLIEGYSFRESSELFRGNPVYVQTLDDRTVKLITVDDDPIHTQYLTADIKPELVIYVSRHSSKSGIPTLSVHTPGNLGEALYGGIPKKVSISPANAMRNALLELVRQKERLSLDGFEVSYECTHHGPSFDVPTMFVEVGSSTNEWMNLEAAEAVAHAVVASVAGRSGCPAMLGVGGPHYNEKFTRIALEFEVAFGHMIPKYAIPELDVGILRECVERTSEEVETAVLDWKGVDGGHRRELIMILEGLGLRIERTDNYK